MILILAILGIVVARVLMKYLWHSENTKWRDWQGKTVLITGGTNGIGRYCVQELVERGARVVFTGRDSTSVMKQMLPEIGRAIKGTHLQAGVFGGMWDEKLNFTSDLLIFRNLDLSDLSHVKQFSDWFRTTGWKIDVLVNNAGAVVQSFKKTKQELEWTMGVNHFSHHYLTLLLMDLIVEEGRIIHTSSAASTFTRAMKITNPIDFGDFLECPEAKYSSFGVYSRSKLANVFFSDALHYHFENTGIRIKSVALHPGAVHSSLAFNAGWMGRVFYYVFFPLMWAFFKSNLEGAQTNLYCMNIPYEELENGGYYDECRLNKKYREQNKQVNRENAFRFVRKSEEVLENVLKVSLDKLQL